MVGCRRTMKTSKPAVPVNIRFCLGVLIGYCIASTLRQICFHRPLHPWRLPWHLINFGDANKSGSDTLLSQKQLSSDLSHKSILPSGTNISSRNLVLVGIMTADKYIETRARAIHDTWGPNIPGNVLFFVGSDSNYTGDLPVVRLDGVPKEDYPPQKKAFKMLEYMYQNYIHQYEWFFRADDDVYIKGKKIESLLRSIDSSKPWYIGQSGEGQRHEQGKLGLIEDMPYCMGGPGVMISHVALSKFGPGIPECMRSVRTKHEDTEVGRCMQRTVGIGCSLAYELGKLLYQNYREKNGSFTHELGRIEKMAFTLHPVKRAPYVYRMHNFINGEKIQTLRSKLEKVQKEIRAMELDMRQITVNGRLAGSELKDEVFENTGVSLTSFSNDSKYLWEYLTGGSYYSHKSVHIKLSTDGRVDESTLSVVSHNWPKRLRETFPHSFLKIDKSLSSYMQISPLDGVRMNVNLQVSLIPRTSHKAQHFFAPIQLRQAFNRLEFFEGKDQFRPFVKQENSIKPIRILIPLSGKNNVLQRFLTRHVPLVSNFVIPVSMVILMFQDPKGEFLHNIETVKSFQSNFPDCDITLMDYSSEIFSRANALTFGANLFGNDSLLLFMDIDMIFTKGFLYRVLQNTIQGHQVYFPVYFSQFDPDYICYQEEGCTVNDFDMGQFSGLWRSYGYGMVGVYKSDFIDVGGFDTTIVGWGKEDVIFHESVLANQLSAFRAADPGLIHLFHKKYCESTLAGDQLKMCIKSKADLWGSTRTLTRLLTNISTPDLEEELNYFLLDSLSIDVV